MMSDIDFVFTRVLLKVIRVVGKARFRFFFEILPLSTSLIAFTHIHSITLGPTGGWFLKKTRSPDGPADSHFLKFDQTFEVRTGFVDSGGNGPLRTSPRGGPGGVFLTRISTSFAGFQKSGGDFWGLGKRFEKTSPDTPKLPPKTPFF